MKKEIILLLTILPTFFTCAQQIDREIVTPETADYTYETVVPDLSNPWGMVFLPDGSMLISEKRGDLIHFANGEKNKIKNHLFLLIDLSDKQVPIVILGHNLLVN